VSGDLLALGAVAALAFASVTRRGSRSKAPEKYTVLATTGDMDPIEYGGGWVYRHSQGHLVWVSIRGLDDEDLESWAGENGYDVDDSDLVEAAYPIEVTMIHVPDPAEVAALIDTQVAEYIGQGQWTAEELGEWRNYIRDGDPQTVVSALKAYSEVRWIENLSPHIYKATTLDLYQQFPHLRGAILRPTLAGWRWVFKPGDPYDSALEELKESRQSLMRRIARGELVQEQVRKVDALLARYEPASEGPK
jgi:hypothetical protein